MRVLIAVLMVLAGPVLMAAEPKVVKGLKNPESVAVGMGGVVYVTLVGDRDQAGDGTVVSVDPETEKIKTFATGLDDPKGMVAVGDALFIVDIGKVWRVNEKGKAETYVSARDFPRPLLYLNDIATDGQGNFYVSDSGDRLGGKGAVYRIDADRKVSLILDGEFTEPNVKVPNGLLVDTDDPDFFFVADFGFGDLYRYNLLTYTARRVGGSLGGPDGIARQGDGSLFVSDRRNGRIFRLDTELEPFRILTERFKTPTDITVTPDGKYLLVPDASDNTLTWFPID